jgi:hypothetical protein
MIKKVLKVVCIFFILELAIVLLIGLASQWDNKSLYGNAITALGYINIALGFLSLIGNANNRLNTGYISTAQRLGMNAHNLINDELASTLKSFRFLIIMFIIGLVDILIASFL